MTEWEQVDEPVLRWVAALPFSYAESARLIELHDGESTPDAPELQGLDWKQIDASLHRLRERGFIAGTPTEYGATSGHIWSRLRIRTQGLLLIDEWPNFDQIATALGVRLLLHAIAEATTDPADKSMLERAANIAGNIGDGVIRGTAGSLGGAGGKKLGEQL